MNKKNWIGRFFLKKITDGWKRSLLYSEIQRSYIFQSRGSPLFQLNAK
jgi:hypothetical protein